MCTACRRPPAARPVPRWPVTHPGHGPARFAGGLPRPPPWHQALLPPSRGRPSSAGPVLTSSVLRAERPRGDEAGGGSPQRGRDASCWAPPRRHRPAGVWSVGPQHPAETEKQPLSFRATVSGGRSPRQRNVQPGARGGRWQHLCHLPALSCPGRCPFSSSAKLRPQGGGRARWGVRGGSCRARPAISLAWDCCEEARPGPSLDAGR